MSSHSSEDPAAFEPRASSRRRWGVAGAVVLALGVAVRLSLPWVLTSQVETRLSEALDAEVSVGDARLGLLAGEVEFQGVAIAPRGGGAPWLASASLRSNLGWLGLLDGVIELEELGFRETSLSLILEDDGSITWPGAVASSGTDEPEVEEEDDGSDPLVLVFEEVTVDRLALAVRDDSGSRDLALDLGSLGVGPVRVVLSDPPVWSLDDAVIETTRADVKNDDATALGSGIRLTADGFDSGSTTPGEFTLGLDLAGGRVDIAGRARPEPLFLDAEIRWNDLELTAFEPLAPAELRPRFESGTAHGRLVVRLGDENAQPDVAAGSPPDAAGSGEPARSAETDEVPETEAASAAAPEAATETVAPLVIEGDGELRIDRLDVAYRAETPMAASWDSLAVEIGDYRLPLGGDEAPEVRLEALRLDRPTVGLTLVAAPDGDAEGSSAEEPEDPEEEVAEASEAGGAEPRLRIGSLIVQGARVRVTDESFDPPLTTTVKGIAVDARELAWPERAARRFSARVDGLSERPVTFNARSDGSRGSGRLVADSVSLLIARPYTRKAAEYSIDRGSVSVESEFEFAGERYEAPTKVVFHDFVITGENPKSNFEQQIGLTPGLALALLRDSDGNVELDLPIAYSGEGAEIGVGTVVARTLRKVMLNALASPLKLARVFGDGGEGLDSLRGRPIPFEPGDDDRLDDGVDEDEVADLASLLKSKPELALRIEAEIVPDDLEVVAEDEDVAPGKPGAPSDEIRPYLDELARRRLAAAREQVVDSLADLENAEQRVAVVPWDGELGSGRPRAVVHLVLRADP